jgi:hypothetical protein
MDVVKKKKGFLDYVKDGFKPANVRAEESVAEDRAAMGGQSQLEIDLKKSKEERIKGFKRGFFDRKHD